MSAPRNIPAATRRHFGEAFGHDAVLSSTAPEIHGHNFNDYSQEFQQIDEIVMDQDLLTSSDQILTDLDEERYDRMVPEQNHQQLHCSTSYPGSGYEQQMYHPYTGELYPKRSRTTSWCSTLETDYTQHSMTMDMERPMAFSDEGINNIFGSGNPVNTGSSSLGSLRWSKQPTKHRPQYPNSEGSRGYVKSKGNKNEPTQIQFRGVEGMVSKVVVEIYDAELDKISEDYVVVELKKRSCGTRPGDSFPINDGSTHDLDHIGIQVRAGEERGNLKKRAKECRMKVTCNIRLDSGEQFQLFEISDKFNCSQDASSTISEIEPKGGNRSGGNLMLLTGKNFKTDDSVVVVFEQIYGGQVVWVAEEKPKAIVKTLIVVKIPAYNGPHDNRDKTCTVNVSVRAGSSNVTNTLEFIYTRDVFHHTAHIKRETGVDNSRGATCTYRQDSRDLKTYYSTEQSGALSTQIGPGNELMIPGNTD